MEKWIDVHGRMMDAVEFTRFIRQHYSAEIESMVEKEIKQEHNNRIKLKRLQETS